jgi:hypothetical protein
MPNVRGYHLFGENVDESERSVLPDSCTVRSGMFVVM